MSAFQRRTFGPTFPTRLELMGIRFVDAGGDGTGAGGDGGDANKPGGTSFTPPSSQEELDRIINGAVARTHKQYEGHDDLKAKAGKWEQHERATADKDKTPDQLDADRAREEGRAEIRAELAAERVDNALRDALKDRALDPNALLLGFDKKQFVKDGGADTDAIKEWVGKHSTEIKAGASDRRDPGQGQRSAAATGGSVQAGRDLYENSKKPSSRKE